MYIFNQTRTFFSDLLQSRAYIEISVYTTISSAKLLSVVAGCEVWVVLKEHTIQTKFHKSQ